MGNFLSPDFWLQLISTVGVPGVFALLVFILRQSDERRMDKIDKNRENDRSEHKEKWNSMVEQHKEERSRSREELERLMRLYERQASATELQASLLIRMNESITTNQYCPSIRKKEKPDE